MQNLYHAQQTAEEEATTVRAMGEKIRRLEQALDEAQIALGKPSHMVIQENYVVGLEDEIASLLSTNHKMRNCGNCNNDYCGRFSDDKREQACKNNNRFHWEMG